MIKEFKEDRHYCDKCKKDAIVTCRGCGVDACMECLEGTFEIYMIGHEITPESAYTVCKKCNTTPPKKIEKEVAYLKQIREWGEEEVKRQREVTDKIEKWRDENKPKSLDLKKKKK